MTLHAVPNQHLHLFPIFYTLWLSPTIQSTLLKLPQLNLYWNDSILQVYLTSCKQLSASPNHFKYHGTLFWNYSNLNYAEKAQSYKYIQILADPFSVQPITKHHVLLLSFSTTTQKPTEICQVSCKNQSHLSTCKQWHKQSSTCKWWHRRSSTCKR